jgi:hypothetical protein
VVVTAVLRVGIPIVVGLLYLSVFLVGVVVVLVVVAGCSGGGGGGICMLLEVVVA